jgi:hypothetical protein
MSLDNPPSAPTTTPCKPLSRFDDFTECSEAKNLFHFRSPNDLDRHKVNRLTELAAEASPASIRYVDELLDQVKVAEQQIDTLVMRLISKEVDRQEAQRQAAHWKAQHAHERRLRIKRGWRKGRAAGAHKPTAAPPVAEKKLAKELQMLRMHVPPILPIPVRKVDNLLRVQITGDGARLSSESR